MPPSCYWYWLFIRERERKRVAVLQTDCRTNVAILIVLLFLVSFSIIIMYSSLFINTSIRSSNPTLYSFFRCCWRWGTAMSPTRRRRAAENNVIEVSSSSDDDDISEMAIALMAANDASTSGGTQLPTTTTTTTTTMREYKCPRCTLSYKNIKELRAHRRKKTWRRQSYSSRGSGVKSCESSKYEE